MGFRVSFLFINSVPDIIPNILTYIYILCIFRFMYGVWLYICWKIYTLAMTYVFMMGHILWGINHKFILYYILYRFSYGNLNIKERSYNSC